MELLLNLCWLLLIGPALYCWMHRRDQSASTRYLIALACLLALLFPIISATDDLHVMRQEMEDSVLGKRTLKQVGIEKRGAPEFFAGPPARVTSAVAVCDCICGYVAAVSPLAPAEDFSHEKPGRAPPSFFFL
jgi:hypothetical protein